MTITTNDLTTGEVSGAGVFDVLMTSMTTHLTNEFRKGHLTGSQFTEVLAVGMPAAMAQSIDFLLRRETTNKQNALLDEQLLTAIKQTEQVGLQNTKLEAETIQVAAQTLQIEAQTLLTNKQLELADKEIEKATKELLLLDQQLLVIALNMDRTQAEIDLLIQKILTEKAQITDSIDGVPVAGVIGKQNELYTQQIAGFTRDNEQKVAKVFTDLYSVVRSTDNGVPIPYSPAPSDPSLAVPLNSEIEALLTHMKTSIVT